MTIKIADLNDLDNLYELNELFENITTKAQMENHLKQNKNEIISIAYIDDIAVGFCTGLIIESICYENCRLDIEALYVKEEYRKNGIGRELIKLVEKKASERNILHFHITSDTKKAATKDFYKKLGYKDTGEILLDKTLN